MRGNLDAVIVGSGPNGLAAAVTLAAAGLKVQVIEGAPEIGGGCRTQELTLPGFRHDVCSAAHPLAVASSFFQRFDLEARGVRFAKPEVEFANPLDGGRAAIVTRSVSETAARLGADGRSYRRLIGPMARHVDDICAELLRPLRRPPAHPLVMAGYGARGILPASALIRRWRTPEARAIMGGAAAHCMMELDAVPTGGIALMLMALAHGVGWPVIAGGSARITDAMADAVLTAGGSIETGRWVRSLAELPSSTAILLDVSPKNLLELAGDQLPGRYRAALRRYRYNPGVCKADFALSGPVPWANEDCRRAGTLHLGGTFEEMATAEAEVIAGKHPENPYVLVVQAGVADPSRAPAGQDTLWAYTHVPAGSDRDVTDRIEAQIERFAPGFRDLILARAVRTAADEEAHNPNYVGGDIAVGMQTMKQTVFRPTIQWNPYRTPVRGVYLCSSATPPVPGVHGRCGELAALTALRDMFGIREAPDIGPAHLRPAVKTHLSERNVVPASGHGRDGSRRIFMILVTGATGNVGRELLRQLAEAGQPVRALTRRDGQAGFPPGVQAVPGDLNDPASLRPALQGVTGVFLLPGYADMPGILAEARQAGVTRVVQLSGSSVGTGDMDNAVTRYMTETEEAVRASGMAWTILRPAMFMSNTLQWLPQLRAGDVVRAPFAYVRAAVTDPADIAAVAALALTADGHEGSVYPVSGPEPLTPADRLAILGQVLGRPLRFEAQPDDEARAEMSGVMPAKYVDAFFRFYADGTLDESVVWPTVRDLTGRPPRTFAQWAAAHAGEFGPKR